MSANKVEEYEASESTDDTGYSSKNGSIAGDESSESETEVFSLVPGCGCPKDKPCPLYKLCADGCPNPTATKVSVLRRKSQIPKASRDRIPTEEEPDFEDYERRTKELWKSYSDMVLEVCRASKKNNTSIQELTLFLQNAFPLLKSRANELNKATSLEEVFKIISDQACSWFDYEMMKDIVQRFGDPYATRCVESYETHFKEYAEHRLPPGLKHIDIGGGAKKGGKQLIVKMDKEWEDVTFRDLDRLRSSFASIFGLHRRDLYLADVQEGCITMKFMLPNELAQKLFPARSRLSSTQIKSLREESATLLRCGKLIWRGSASKKGRKGGNYGDGCGSKVNYEKSLQVAKLDKRCQSSKTYLLTTTVVMLCLVSMAIGALLGHSMHMTCGSRSSATGRLPAPRVIKVECDGCYDGCPLVTITTISGQRLAIPCNVELYSTLESDDEKFSKGGKVPSYDDELLPESAKTAWHFQGLEDTSSLSEREDQSTVTLLSHLNSTNLLLPNGQSYNPLYQTSVLFGQLHLDLNGFLLASYGFCNAPIHQSLACLRQFHVQPRLYYHYDKSDSINETHHRYKRLQNFMVKYRSYNFICMTLDLFSSHSQQSLHLLIHENVWKRRFRKSRTLQNRFKWTKSEVNCANGDSNYSDSCQIFPPEILTVAQVHHLP